jgi:hypothetical protein
MRRLSAAAVALLLSCGAAAAQTMSTSPVAPALGAVSPLGIPGASYGTGASTGMSGPSAGIGLGATEINPGGISPAVSPSCISGSSSSGMASGSSSSFDGGGLSGIGSSGMTTGCVSTAVGSATGTALPPSSVGSSALSGTIPLGSTELTNAGVSPLIGVPAPNVGIPAPSVGIGGFTGSTLPGTPPMSSTGTLGGY